MVNGEDSVLLSEYCFNVCEALNATIQGKNANDLSECVRTALEDLGRWVECPLPRACLPPNRFDLGLCVKSSGISGGGRIGHALNTARTRLRSTSWRSKRYSRLSTRRVHPSMKTSARANVPPAWRPWARDSPTNPPDPRVVRLQLHHSCTNTSSQPQHSSL